MNQPIYLVSVNTTPLRAKELVVILAEDLKHEYNLVHVANSETISGVEPLLRSLVAAPQLLICSSQWDEEEQEKVRIIARNAVQGINLITIPSGLNAQRGGEAVVEFLKEQVQKSGLPKRK